MRYNRTCLCNDLMLLQSYKVAYFDTLPKYFPNFSHFHISTNAVFECRHKKIKEIKKFPMKTIKNTAEK